MTAQATLTLPTVTRHEYLYRCPHCHHREWLTVQVPHSVAVSCGEVLADGSTCKGRMVYVKRRIDKAAVDRLINELVGNYR